MKKIAEAIPGASGAEVKVGLESGKNLMLIFC